MNIYLFVVKLKIERVCLKRYKIQVTLSLAEANKQCDIVSTWQARLQQGNITAEEHLRTLQ
jgi:hypothetical protein